MVKSGFWCLRLHFTDITSTQKSREGAPRVLPLHAGGLRAALSTALSPWLQIYAAEVTKLQKVSVAFLVFGAVFKGPWGSFQDTQPPRPGDSMLGADEGISKHKAVLLGPRGQQPCYGAEATGGDWMQTSDQALPCPHWPWLLSWHQPQSFLSMLPGIEPRAHGCKGKYSTAGLSLLSQAILNLYNENRLWT